jgi:hypothetical protein
LNNRLKTSSTAPPHISILLVSPSGNSVFPALF